MVNETGYVLFLNIAADHQSEDNTDNSCAPKTGEMIIVNAYIMTDRLSLQDAPVD